MARLNLGRAASPQPVPALASLPPSSVFLSVLHFRFLPLTSHFLQLVAVISQTRTRHDSVYQYQRLGPAVQGVFQFLEAR